MKKILAIFLVSFVLLFIFSSNVLALCDESNGGTKGLVPCGVAVDSSGKPTCPCQLGHFFVMAAGIYGFIVKYIATTLAVLMITVGAVFMLISAGNPNLAGTGRKMVYSAIIGLILVFGSWLIIDALLKVLGYNNASSWFQLP